ncbi:MAG: valine--tRNA ligase [Planctomycetota bacterium]
MSTPREPIDRFKNSTMTQELSKTYVPSEHETRIWQRWIEAGAFHADPTRVASGDAPPYCVLIPPPNVTAALHLGHALNNTLQDVLVRAHRMKGFETLWMPGTDHAGIATQTIVDKRLKEAGEPALADYKKMQAGGEPGREQFIEKVQSWKDEFEARITDQLQQMGCSCDWSRQRFTMDPVCARAVREAFYLLFRDGLIERGKRLVNWDPVTQTALADDEVENEEIDGAFYYLRYPLVHPLTNEQGSGDHRPVTWGELSAKGYPGADQHPEGDEAWITVATTRPETYLGDTGVAVNPTDPRAEAVRGLKVKLPLVGRVISIIEDDYVVLPVAYGGPEGDPKAEFATGFLKVTPAHDPNDWELGQRHDLDAINVMAPDASISPDYGWEDYDSHAGASVFVGLGREDARKKVVEEFQGHTLNNQPLLEETKPYRHSVGHSYRSHAAVEYYLSDQWYCRVTDDRLVGSAQRSLVSEQRTSDTYPAQSNSDGTMTFSPPRYAKTFETWHDNLRDWCISRQLWWGHQIPVWSRTDDATKAPDGAFEDTLANWMLDDRIAIQASENEATGEITRSVCIRSDNRVVIEALEAAGFVRDPDVLDTWFSSALWPLSTLGWPNHTLPIVASEQIDPNAHVNIKSVWVKRVGSWRDFIGSDEDASGDLIDRLLHLRDTASTADGTQPLSYQLFSEKDIRENGTKAAPLAHHDAIASAEDMICAVGVKASATLESTKFGQLNIPDLLLEHGFQDTAGLLEAFNPTSVLTTAREIITLWVSRMAMFNRYFLAQGETAGPPPFKDVFIHAMIQDGEGRKMSKSLGNGVNPLDIIATHGADAMRFTLVEMTTQTQDVRMPVEHDAESGKNTSPKFDLGRNFCNKLWNAARFAMSKLDANETFEPDAIKPTDLSLADRWMLARLHAGVVEIDQALATYHFSSYAKTLYDVVRRDFCDWYLEAIKPTVANDPKQRAVLRHTLDALLRVLHPVAPFITEAISESLSEIPAPPIEGLSLAAPRKDETLCTAGWPVIDDALADAEALDSFEKLRELVEAIRGVRSQHKVDPKRKIVFHPAGPLAESLGDTTELVKTLAGLASISADEPEDAAVAFTFDSTEHRLSNLADAIDAGAEAERLQKELADLDKSIKSLEGRLSNPGYVDKAPEHLVNQTRDQLTKAKADRDQVAAALERLS